MLALNGSPSIKPWSRRVNDCIHCHRRKYATAAGMVGRPISFSIT